MEWHDFPKLTTAQELYDYLIEQPLKHTNYYYYSRIEIINSILKKQELWLSKVSGYNDTLDTEQYDPPELYFGLCFSTGTSENLPLWYLYGGLEGNGARVGFTRNGMQYLLNNTSYKLVAENGDSFDLRVGEDIELSFRDMLYTLKTNHCHYSRIKYNTMTINHFSSEELDAFLKMYSGFRKGLIWHYEKETRLLAKIKSDTARTFVKKHENEKDMHIAMDLTEVIKKRSTSIKVMLAPAYTDISEVDDLMGWFKLAPKSPKIELSEYNGTINLKKDK